MFDVFVHVGFEGEFKWVSSAIGPYPGHDAVAEGDDWFD